MRKLLALALAALATVSTVVWEAGRWVIRAIRPAAPQAGAVAEDALAELAQANQPTDEFGLRKAEPGTDYPEHSWGQAAFAYALAVWGAQPEPSLLHLEPQAEAWLRGLSDEELRTIVDYGPSRVDGHIWGLHPIPSLTPCMVLPKDRLLNVGEHPYWTPPVHKPVVTEEQATTLAILEDLMADNEPAYCP